MPITIAAKKITEIACDVLVCPRDDASTDKSFSCNKIQYTVCPPWHGGKAGEEERLRECYISGMRQAVQHRASSVAFPLLGTEGNFPFPKNRVFRIAFSALTAFLYSCDDDPDVYLCVPDPNTYELPCARALEQYLHPPKALFSINLSQNSRFKRRTSRMENDAAVCAPGDTAMLKLCPASAGAAPDLEQWLKKQDDSFAVTLMKLIDRKGLTDVECYKKANVSRKTFSKLNTDPNYRPSKQTVLAFAVALELTLPETEQLLKTVGFSLSHSSTFDMILEFFIVNGQYDIYEINEALFRYDQVCLGC